MLRGIVVPPLCQPAGKTGPMLKVPGFRFRGQLMIEAVVPVATKLRKASTRTTFLLENSRNSFPISLFSVETEPISATEKAEQEKVFSAEWRPPSARISHGFAVAVPVYPLDMIHSRLCQMDPRYRTKKSLSVQTHSYTCFETKLASQCIY